MAPLGLVRPPWAEGEPARERVARGGVRVARVGITALLTAGKLRGLRAMGPRDAARERALVLRDASRRVLELHGIDVDAEGPFPLGPAVLVANHVSWLDPLVVASLVPCAPISKADVSRWPVVGTIARELGVIFFRRGDPRSGATVLRAASAALGRGVPVLNFPEGTTTTGWTVLPFRKGIFGLAIRSRLPVVPIALRYDPPELAWVGEEAFLPHYLRLAGGRVARVEVRLGAPIPAMSHARADSLALAAWECLSRLLGDDS
jgi:1-acyl-sn-glycerol-3-phosphate acyltransferase